MSLFECRIPFLNAGFPFLNAGSSVLKKENRTSFLRTGFAPKIFQDVERYPPKCFVAITCTVWLRLEFRGLGSACLFSAYLLFVHAQGRFFEPGIRFLDLGSTFWPGDLFGVKNGSRKKLFCDGIILSWQFRGIAKTKMNSMVHRTHLGRLRRPKPLYFNDFQGISYFP